MFLLYFCLFYCVCVHVHVCVCTQMWWYTKRPEFATEYVFNFSAPYSLRQCLSLNLEFLGLKILAGQQAPRVFLLLPCCCWSHRCVGCLLGFYIGAEDPNSGSSCLYRTYFTALAILCILIS